MRTIVPVSLRRSAALAVPTDWRPNRPFFPPTQGNEPLGRYYIDWFPGNCVLGESWLDAPRDDNGVLLTADGRSYHPVRIAQYGLHSHAKWLATNDESPRTAFRAHAAWLRDNRQVHRGVSGCYPYDFAYPHNGAAAGWLSAMAQGEAISLLLRADESFPGEGFVQAAYDAAQPFRLDVREGGVVYRTGDDVFLEEVAVVPAGHILNGAIYAWWGLWDLNRRRNETWIASLLADSLSTLRRNLRRYDSGYWSYYDMLVSPNGFRRVVTLKYHAFHIAQLRVLAMMTEDALFETFADRFEFYTQQPLCRARMLLNTALSLIPRFVTHTDTVPGGATTLVS